MNASLPEIKASLYSGRAASFTEQRLCDGCPSMSMTICAFLPRLRAMQQMPAAAPTTSMSACAWPMTKIWPACGNELAEGVGHHAGFDLRALFGGLGLAAVEFKVKAVAHDDLVAAARERHFDREHGVLIERFVVIHVLAHADRERCGDAVLSDDASHRVEHGEFTLKQLLILLLGRDEHVAVTIEFAQQAVRILEPCADLFVDGGEHRAARRLAASLHQLFVVVDAPR